MLAEELINPTIPILTLQDTVAYALDMMEEHKLSQLVLADDEAYVGLINEDVLLNWHTDTDPLAKLYLPQQPIKAHLYQHIYELIELSNQFQLVVIPVLDEDGLLAGSINVAEMMAKFAALLGVQETGAVVVLSMPAHQYSLTDISRLVEANNTKILSSYFTKADYGTLDEATLTLKLNRTDITAVVATFERFGYQVTGAFANQAIEHPDRQRLDMLMRYLET